MKYGIAFTANRNSFGLVATPQSDEWDIMKGSALRADFTNGLRVFVITPSVDDRSTDRIYGDEFGCVSSVNDATAQEMFKAAVRLRFPAKMPKGSSYTLASGRTPPVGGAYDLVIDMRKLKALRDL